MVALLSIDVTVPAALTAVAPSLRMSSVPTETPARVRLAQVEYGDIEQLAMARGAVRYEQEYAAIAPVTGVVAEVYVEPGDRVTAGQPLLRLDASAEEAALELETTDSAVYSSAIDPQQLADERQADVAVTYELLPEMEVCTCETLGSGAVLYLLETADGAVNLSRIYGVELYQATIHSGSCSYALLLPQE